MHLRRLPYEKHFQVTARRGGPRAKPVLITPLGRGSHRYTLETYRAACRTHGFQQASLPYVSQHRRLSGTFRAAYLVIRVADSEVAHTDDDLVKEAFTGDVAAVAQQGAGDVSECQGQALCPYNGLAKTRAVRTPAKHRARPGLCASCHSAGKHVKSHSSTLCSLVRGILC